MKHSDRIMLTLENFSQVERFIIESTSSAVGVFVEDVLTNSKNRKVVLARAMIARLLSEFNYSSVEIGRLLGVSQRMAYEYIHSHDNRMADSMYEYNYVRLKELIDNRSNDNWRISEMIHDIDGRVFRLEQRVSHLSKMVTE